MTSLELFETDWRDLWSGEPQEAVGAIYTRPEIVDLILDLAGYVCGSSRLACKPLLEPSCGDGAFLSAVIARLVRSEIEQLGSVDWGDETLDAAICAADISEASVKTARALIRAELRAAGCPAARARALATKWTFHTDFLLQEWPGRFAFVVGNPPYVRLEALPKRVLARYRERFTTLTDRADLYVAFFERGLELLDDRGALSFICANRFAKNQYGATLRALIASRFRVRHYVNLEHTQPFLSDVSAYPAIIVVDRQAGAPTRAATLDDCLPSTLNRVRRESLAPRIRSASLVSEFRSWYTDGSPWRTTSTTESKFFDYLASHYPTLESSAACTKVGIGVATGADEVFVLAAKHDEIESSRQLPLLMASDIAVDRLTWSGHYLVNPFADEDDGSLAELGRFPGFRAHLERHATRLLARHVAQTRPATWYRTIDRVWPRLRAVPKLVIPDIQAGGVVGLDRGNFYPHHNVYWVTSEGWELSALQALLRSSLILAQVRAFSVQMRGGSLRYQAQTLRRLRVPARDSISATTIDSLCRIAPSDSQAAIDEIAKGAFSLPDELLPQLTSRNR